MSDQLTRREFMKLTAALGASLALPASVLSGCGAEIVFTDIRFDDAAFEEALTLGPICRGAGCQAGIKAHLDMDKVWRAVMLIDNSGGVWRTEDGGQTWSDGRLSFEVCDV